MDRSCGVKYRQPNGELTTDCSSGNTRCWIVDPGSVVMPDAVKGLNFEEIDAHRHPLGKVRTGFPFQATTLRL